MAGASSDLRRYPMTVVIATLGGGSLKGTIEAINRGTIVPDEILICIPVKEAHRAHDFPCSNVKVLVTDCRGQVAQRAIGFQNASYEVVMQLDDDMLVDEQCIAYLLKTLSMHGPKAAVAPSLINVLTGESIYKKPERNKILEKLYYWFMNGSAGYQEGKIEKSGSAVGVDPGRGNKESYDVEWLPGGCVMHFKNNLVLENYYPFEGKAYCEDIIHSYYLKSRGVNLIVDSGALCALEVISASSYGPKEFLRDLVADFHARKFFLQLCVRNSIRIYFFYFESCLSYVFKKVNRFRIFGERGTKS